MALMLAHLYGAKLLRLFILLSIFITAFFVLFKGGVDPFTWFYYFIFSLAIYWGAFQFKRWAFAKSTVLDEELDILYRDLEFERSTLQENTRQTETVQQRADEISHLYDKIKEMSQSLDMLETFLLFGEALAKHFRFHTIKLALFNEEQPRSQHPDEVYGLSFADFQSAFEKGVFIKDRKRAKAPFFPFDQKICEIVFKKQESFCAIDTTGQVADENVRLWPDFMPLVAEPIFIHKKIFAVLIILGVDKNELPVLSILTERFVSEAKRIQLYEKVQTLAVTDGLTGVYVRRHLVERLEGEVRRSKRFGYKLSFLMIDIDHFKRFNDEYGHLVGDVVLKKVAETIRKNIREIDLVGRYGGEEFGVLLIETDEAGAFFVAERMRRAIEEKMFIAYDETLKVTISIGCSAFSQSINDVSLIVDAADSALYQAKRQGRNRVCVSTLSNSGF